MYTVSGDVLELEANVVQQLFCVHHQVFTCGDVFVPFFVKHTNHSVFTLVNSADVTVISLFIWMSCYSPKWRQTHVVSHRTVVSRLQRATSKLCVQLLWKRETENVGQIPLDCTVSAAWLPTALHKWNVSNFYHWATSVMSLNAISSLNLCCCNRVYVSLTTMPNIDGKLFSVVHMLQARATNESDNTLFI